MSRKPFFKTNLDKCQDEKARTVCEPLYPFQIFPNMPKAGQLQSVQWEPKRGASIWPPDNLATWPSGHLIHSLWRAATPASNNNGLQSAVGPNKSWSWQGWEARAEHQNMSHTAAVIINIAVINIAQLVIGIIPGFLILTLEKSAPMEMIM